MDRREWNNFIVENNGSFLQSWEWGEFQSAFGRRVCRLGGSAAGWRAQFIEMTAPIINRSYWYCPRGPVIDRLKNGKERLDVIEEIIKDIKKTEFGNVLFFRLGPEWRFASGEELIAVSRELKGLDFRRLHYDIEPSQTLILDLRKTEEDLLAQMREKWRYNIRLAERKGVKIKIVGATDADFVRYFEGFYQLMDKGTAERKKIQHHTKEYYQKQLAIAGDLKVKLCVAECENNIIAANIVAIFGRTATYLHGATANERREVMAPHLLQWEQIKYARQAGCVRYDFWGIVNEHTADKRGLSWLGFTRFKKGFGGREENYIGYWDYPLRKFWYGAYRLVQKIRR